MKGTNMPMLEVARKLVANIEDEMREREKLHEEIEKLKEKIADLLAEPSRTRETEVRAAFAEGALEVARANYEKAAKERDSLRQKLQDQEQGMQNLSDKVEGLEGTLEKRDAEIVLLKGAARAIERMYEPQLAKERMNAKAEHDLRVQAERRLTELMLELAERTLERDLLRGANDSLADLADLGKKYELAIEVLAERRAEMERLTLELEAVKRSHAGCAGYANGLLERARKATDVLAEKGAAMDDLADELAREKVTTAALRSEIAALKGEKR